MSKNNTGLLEGIQNLVSHKNPPIKHNKLCLSTWSDHIHLGYQKIIRYWPFGVYDSSTWPWNSASDADDLMEIQRKGWSINNQQPVDLMASETMKQMHMQ